MVNDVRTELHYDNTWNDVTLDVRYDPPITVKWGRADEAAKPAPSSMSLTLNNGTSNVNPAVSGRYSPRNPRSDLFGKIGRNTPLRCRMGPRQAGMLLPGVNDSYASTPDNVNLDITGDIDIRMELEPNSWRPADVGELFLSFARKYETGADQRSWGWWLSETGALRVRWSPDGTFTNAITKTSTVDVPADFGRGAIRWTLDVDNGAAGNDVKFYTAPSMAGPWTQLGTTITTAGVTSVFASSAPLEVGRTNSPTGGGITEPPFMGDVYAFEVRSGIDGVARANPDFSAREPGTTTFTDAAGRVWTLNGQAAITDPSIRFSGEVSAWPPEWDLSGKDVRVPIEASGIRRRLGQGEKPLRSSLYRDLSGRADVVAYWPLEEGKNATTFASGRQGDTSLLRSFGKVSPANSDVFVASAPLPTIDAGYIQGTMPGYAGAIDQRISFVVHVPPEGVAGDRVLALFTTGKPYTRWDVVLGSAGTLRFRAFNDEMVELFNGATVGFNLNGQVAMFSLWLTKAGADTIYQMAVLKPGETVAQTFTDSVLGRSFDRFRSVQLGTTIDMAGTTYGHAMVLNDDVHSIWDVVGSSLNAWSGETAGERIMRLTGEEGIPLRVIGNMADTEVVGPQRVDTLTNLLDEAAGVDLGILTDDRDAVRLLFRAKSDLYSQVAALTLDYAAGQVAPPLEPVEDDQLVRNDVTAKRPGGSEYQAVRTTGPLSVQAPPAGVGRYDTAEDVNVHSDAQLVDQAGWRLHLGTIDEARYPQITVDLTATPSLAAAAMAARAGDRVQIINPPAWLPPDTIDQLAQGGTEALTPHRHTITFNTSPGSPWTVGKVSDGADEQRVDTSGSETTASFVAGTSTLMTVAVTSGPLWTTAAGEFPLQIRVSGVVLTVTAITGIASPQTFTVQAAPVNGVMKTIPAGSDVRLANPMIVAL